MREGARRRSRAHETGGRAQARRLNRVGIFLVLAGRGQLLIPAFQADALELRPVAPTEEIGRPTAARAFFQGEQG